MNPDNPYAAPQTVELAPPLAVAVFDDTRRLRFTECSTARLSLLLDYSYAIQQMHVMWILFAFLGFCVSLILAAISLDMPAELVATLGWVAGMSFLIARVAVGYSHARPCRAWAMFCDGLLAVGTLWLSLVLLQEGALVFALLSGFVCLHASASFLAYLRAVELFGPQPLELDELIGEIANRKMQGID